MPLDWEKANRSDMLRATKSREPKSRKRATDKQRDLINKLLREVGYSGEERKAVWDCIQNPVDASMWIGQLLTTKRGKAA